MLEGELLRSINLRKTSEFKEWGIRGNMDGPEETANGLKGEINEEWIGGHPGKDLGVLILHGFCGETGDVRLLAETLSAGGYLVEAPLLAGHGTAKEELARTTYFDWIASAEQAYLRLAGKTNRIVAVGFSMGGLLTANLWNYGFAGIITVNTPVYYWNFKNIGINLMSDFRGSLRKYFRAADCSPWSTMLEFQKLLIHTKPMFSNITSKALIIQAMDDDTVHHKSADYIYGKLCGEKSMYRVTDGGHMLFCSKRGPEICGVIERFIQKVQAHN